MPGPMCRARSRPTSLPPRTAIATLPAVGGVGTGLPIGGARRRGLRGPARLRARRAAEAHGLEGVGARRRSRRCRAIRAWPRSPNGWTGPPSRARRPRPACRSCACGCWRAMPRSASMVCGFRARRFAPARGAAHRFACLRALAAVRDSRSRDESRSRLVRQLAGDLRLPRARRWSRTSRRCPCGCSRRSPCRAAFACCSRARARGPAARRALGRCRARHRAAVPAVPHLQRPVRGHRAAGLDGGIETARDATRSAISTSSR